MLNKTHNIIENQIIEINKSTVFNFKLIWFQVVLSLLILGCEKAPEDKIVDIDGNTYDTVRIGTQVWMKENLRTTRLNDGTEIQLVPYAVEWELLQTPGYCWYGNHEAFFSLNHYGALYNSYAVNTGKLCPTGWHVPTDADWVELSRYVGWDSGGGKLKEEGTVNWASPNSDATNETGFSALPGGYRNAYYKDYDRFRYRACFWTFKSSGSFELNNYDSNTTSRPSRSIKDGASVRCIMDK
jgi:uncharacterized protein (TIGR02145 family)